MGTPWHGWWGQWVTLGHRGHQWGEWVIPGDPLAQGTSVGTVGDSRDTLARRTGTVGDAGAQVTALGTVGDTGDPLAQVWGTVGDTGDPLAQGWWVAPGDPLAQVLGTVGDSAGDSG